MPEREDSYYSEPVQEIMGTIPSWITLWGITVIAGIFMLIIIGCCIIKYPQTLTSSISLTSVNPPSDLTSRYSGLLDSVYVTNGDKVCKGQLIALISTPADYNHILFVESIIRCHSGDCITLSSDSTLYCTYTLGDLQSVWGDLVRACSDYRSWKDIDQIGIQRRLISEQIERNSDYYNDLLAQNEFLQKDLEYEIASFRRDSILMIKRAISQAEYESSVKSLLGKRSSLASFNATLTSSRLNVLQLEQRQMELDIQRQNEESAHIRTITQLSNQMLSQIAQWKELYTIIAPSDGFVSLQSVWSRGQHVSVGDVIASLVPSSDKSVFGRLTVPSSGFGKVEKGQSVNVRLNGFPYMEFGILKGVVSHISAVPRQVSTSEGAMIVYTVDVAFPDGLVSSYGKQFPMVQQMDGTAEIITRDRRLIEQFIDPIISLFKNR